VNKSLKEKVKTITRKTTPMTFDERIQKLKETYQGWLNYFRMASIHGKLKEIDEWLRNRIRYCLWHNWYRVIASSRPQGVTTGTEKKKPYPAWSGNQYGIPMESLSNGRMGYRPKPYFRHHYYSGEIMQKRIRILT
jgi:RNA-directed DNA polymerase